MFEKSPFRNRGLGLLVIFAQDIKKSVTFDRLLGLVGQNYRRNRPSLPRRREPDFDVDFHLIQGSFEKPNPRCPE